MQFLKHILLLSPEITQIEASFLAHLAQSTNVSFWDLSVVRHPSTIHLEHLL